MGDRYFHLATGAGRCLIENSEYARAQQGQPMIKLGDAIGDSGDFNSENMSITAASREEEAAAANQFPDENAYLQRHNTGYISSDSYSDESFNLATHPWQTVEH